MARRWFGRNRPARALFGGIRIRLFGMILLVALPLMGAVGVSLYRERQASIEAAHVNAIDRARRVAERYQRVVLEARTRLDVISQVPEVIASPPDTCRSFLLRVGGNRGWERGIWVIGADGRVVCATTPNAVGIDLSSREYFHRAVGNREFVLSDFFVGAMGSPMNVVAMPVISRDGAVIGVVSIGLDLAWFNKLAAEAGRPDDALVLLFDGAGNLLARYPEKPEYIGRNWRGYPLMERMMEVPEGSADVNSSIGAAQIFGWVAVPGTPARIAVGFDRAKVLSRVDYEVATAALVVLLVMALAALASFPLARGIVQPLKLLTAGAEAARDRMIESLPVVHGYAEVRSLAKSLDKLLAERGTREEELVEARAGAERAERQAREAHARLSAAIEMLPEGIAIFDVEDRFALWNRRYAELYGCDGEGPAVGMKFEVLVRQVMARGEHPGAVGREEEWLAERLAMHNLPQCTHEQPLAGDRWLRVEERHMADGGTIGIWVDITDLKRREASFRLLFDSNPLPMWVYDRESLRFLAVNDAAVRHYGYGREQFLAMTILDIRPPELREEVERAVRAQVEWRPGRLWQHAKADGSAITVEVYTRALTYADRSAALVAVIDVSERMRTESELRQTRAFLDAVVENIPAMLFVKDAKEHRYVLFNRAGEELLGVPRAELIGRNDHDLFPKREADQFVARDHAVLRAGELQITEEERVHTPHNGLRLLRTKKIAISDDSGRPKYLLGIAEDITERKRAEGRITHMAHHDSMTGLANRVLLRERLEHALARMLEQESRLAVLYIDLDCFKDVNDALGHPVGDALLRMAAERLRGCVREGDTVARLGGDEFAIIQDSLRDDDEASDLARRVAAVLGAPFQVEGHDVTVSASVGIAMAPRDGADPDTLLKFADMALYAAKTDGRRTFRFFEVEMNERLHARRAMEIDLRLAFERNEFDLYYQPTIDIASGRIVGFEALLRWHHPERGIVAPGEFIALAESIGLIVPLGEWVLRQACAEAAQWPDDVTIAVNLSPLQFKNANLVETVTAALAAAKLPPRRLELEITESVLLQENENNPATLHRLRDLGVRIALDDFGTGYSSLSYLRVFPFDRIKIDGSFVKELPHNVECVSIVRAMADLARGLHMATTAEGVETPEQLEALRAHGCTAAQGYLFSRPLPAGELREFLARYRPFAVQAA
ncbi:MAG TPA: EAL domain-containing protein [Xanthobacteraceae bacterium]|jgi:diguanylate cyclase (GGDEF)-like protein/PAS domain S-box-containing protein|nr:EAL domain-containing protein [Xanthobacteraceae bacterium]